MSGDLQSMYTRGNGQSPAFSVVGGKVPRKVIESCHSGKTLIKQHRGM